MTVGRRKRALRWIKRLNEHQKSVAEGNKPSFSGADLVDYVWDSPLGEGFGD